MSGWELADYEVSTGHVHGCSEHGCDCIHHLYAIAQDAEARLAAVEALADEWDTEFKHRNTGPQFAARLRAALRPDPDASP